MASGHVNRAKKAEHMAAPTKPANVKKALANSEPSTHGTTRLSSLARTLACKESPTAEQNTERERDPRLANGAFGRAPPAEDIWSLRAASRVQTSPISLGVWSMTVSGSTIRFSTSGKATIGCCANSRSMPL
jgi:hypothetical protein